MAVFDITVSVETSTPAAFSNDQINQLVNEAVLVGFDLPVTLGPISVLRSGNRVTVSLAADVDGPRPPAVGDRLRALITQKLRNAFPAPGSTPAPSPPPAPAPTPAPQPRPSLAPVLRSSSKISVPVLVGIGLVTTGLVYYALSRPSRRRR